MAVDLLTVTGELGPEKYSHQKNRSTQHRSPLNLSSNFSEPKAYEKATWQ